MGNNYLWGINSIKDSVEQIENKLDSLLNRTYNFGENQTPFTFNGKKVYVYKYNPDETLTLPGTGYIAMGNNVIDEIISVNLMGNIDNWESGILWFQFPMIKRGNAGQQVLFGINPGGYPAVKNYGVTGPIKIKGYVVYTRD